MNRNYQSDLDANDPQERPLMAADRKALRNLALWVIVLLALEVLGVIWIRSARADEPAGLGELLCVPTVSDFDHAYRIEGAVAAGLWWCDQPDGLHVYWITGTVPGGITPQTQADALLQIAGKDPAEILQRVIVRDSTPSEMELVARVELDHGPRCYVTGTAATAAVLTSTAQGTLGPPKLDAAGVGIRVPVGAPLSCGERLAKETLKRYCDASTLTDTKGRRVPAETWAPCKIERAPADGWPK